MEVYSRVNGDCALRSKFVTRELRMRFVRKAMEGREALIH
jgi:hypothetical protein